MTRLIQHGSTTSQYFFLVERKKRELFTTPTTFLLEKKEERKQYNKMATVCTSSCCSSSKRSGTLDTMETKNCALCNCAGYANGEEHKRPCDGCCVLLLPGECIFQGASFFLVSGLCVIFAKKTVILFIFATLSAQRILRSS